MPDMEKRVIGVLKKQKKTAISINEIVKKAGIKKSDKDELFRLLRGLIDDNKLIDDNGRYALVESLGLITAEIVKVNATFGFARPVSGERDVFIPGRMLSGSMPGDTVLIQLKKGSGDLPEGAVRKVLRESNPKFSGILQIDRGFFTVVPDRYVKFPVKLAGRSCAGLSSGDKILARIIHRGPRHSEHIAEVVSSFGDSSRALACCGSILAANDIYPEFPVEVLEQAKAIASGQGIHPKELAARVDLRGETIFTIDGADTKDIDDAVSLKNVGNGWELGVHIADVSYYVTHMTPVDMEAFSRGTSVYYADSVVPMLPKELSNGICSLNPGEDRLAFSVTVQLDSEAKIDSFKFEKTVIRSRLKGVYEEINKALEGEAGPEITAKYSGVWDMLTEMDALAKRLTKNRYNRGGVDFDSTECKIILDGEGTPVDILPRRRGASEMIIEEFMLVANESAARLAVKERLPFVYRVHERPAPNKLAQLFDTLEKLGVSFKRPKGRVSSDVLIAILEQAKGADIEDIVSSMVLRSMAKAKYSEDNLGHFGLALDDYAHFTSPIRRYPDLTIHRVLSAFVTGMRRDNINKRFGAFTTRSAARSTERELAAAGAERDCVDAYKAEYMSRYVGQEYDGIISSVTQFGCYVRLDNTVEGLIRVQSFPPGDWQFDGSISFADTTGTARLRLGDRARVRVAAADVSAGHVDFEYVNTIPHERQY